MKFIAKDITNLLKIDNNEYYDINNILPKPVAFYQHEDKWYCMIGYSNTWVLYYSYYEFGLNICDTGNRYELHFVRKNKI